MDASSSPALPYLGIKKTPNFVLNFFIIFFQTLYMFNKRLISMKIHNPMTLPYKFETK